MRRTSVEATPFDPGGQGSIPAPATHQHSHCRAACPPRHERLGVCAPNLALGAFHWAIFTSGPTAQGLRNALSP